MSSYHYRCLPPGCIRLLRLSPHEDDTAPIRCQLFEYSLVSARRKGTHLYKALSYCWGSPSKSQTAFVDEGLLHITENLHAALLRLRDPALERIIWIDAICINQDDLDEKGLQVQLMAEIFARASCVIVWLEYVTGDHLIDSESEAAGRQAIQVLEAAATRPTEAPSDDEHDVYPEYEQRLAVKKLLERPWFRRIWVLQEVAAARHVLIMCKLAEIDGQAFCSGHDRVEKSLTLLLKDGNSRSRIRSTVDLIKDATFRSKAVVNNTSERFSLRISSLGYLIELHRIREATDRRDKIYALLGMSTDTPTGLIPNYQMSWKDLLPHVVKSLLPKSSMVTTIDEYQTALFTIPGRVIGVVRSALNKDTFYDEQLVSVSRHESDGQDFDDCPESWIQTWKKPWNFQRISKRIYKGDIVCLLKGKSIPTIVRAHQDYCSIVVIAVGTEVHMESPWYNNTEFDFLLTWSWKEEKHPSHLAEFLIARGVSPVNCIALQSSDDLNTAVMLLETEQYYSAIWKVHSFILASDDVGESERADVMAVARFLDMIRKVFLNRGCHESFDMLKNLIGKKREYVDVTEEFLIPFIKSAREWEQVAFVLNTQGTPVIMTENLLITAAGNEYCGKGIVEVLLECSNNQISVTDKCLTAATLHPRDCAGTITLLLNSKAVQINITEDFLVALAASDYGHLGKSSSWVVMRQLLELGGDRINITENILIAAAANKSRNCISHATMIGLFVAQKNFQITITESVLLAAAANEGNSASIMEALFLWKKGHFTITENVLAAAATNKGASVDDSLLTVMFCERKELWDTNWIEDRTKVTNQVIKAVYQNLSDGRSRDYLRLQMKKRGIH
ncbi:het domain protein [Colletotrichum kahawae]|uniref:Het domain protein n=1 Tax=Colletotrichum kahawae TaxID=34407 RepID=A0AAD9YAW1_COLKA|nr:het domain protein [Colletotrichum kahawae]